MMNFYKSITHAFKKDLIGSNLDEVLSAVTKMGFSLESIMERGNYVYVRLYSDLPNDMPWAAEVNLTFTPSELILKSSKIGVYSH